LLARTGHGLRLASYQAHAEGWLVARASLLALAPPGKAKHYVAVVAPDPSGAHDLEGVPQGWSVERTEPTACFFYVGRDGRMWAFSTERGRPGYRVRTREVALSALVFVTARSPAGPRVTEARNWRHGVYVGASLMRNAGAASAVHDPFGMADDCGLGIGEYVEDWLTIGRQLTVPLRVFTLDVARSPDDPDGGVRTSGWLPWIHARLENAAAAVVTPIGFAPSVGWIERAGLGAPRHAIERLSTLDLGALLDDAERAGGFFARLGDQLSTALHVEQRELSKRLRSSIH
jgi:GTP-dependent phosphoenolpyruvate carboxykinase